MSGKFGKPCLGRVVGADAVAEVDIVLALGGGPEYLGSNLGIHGPSRVSVFEDLRGGEAWKSSSTSIM